MGAFIIFSSIYLACCLLCIGARAMMMAIVLVLVKSDADADA